MDNVCPICKNLLRITASSTEVTGDTSGDEETKVFTVQELSCRSKGCGNFGKVVVENRVQIYPPIKKESDSDFEPG